MSRKQTKSFRIADLAISAPGRLAFCPLPGRDGDPAADLARVMRWRPDLVLSMTPADEMEAHGAADLGERLHAAGIAHEVFPVRDFGVPERADDRWPPLSTRLHAILGRGGALLLHCLGGQGRSGMVAMRLLVERGMPPAQALALVRVARDGAVETPAQEGWAAAGRSRRQVSRIVSRAPR